MFDHALCLTTLTSLTSVDSPASLRGRQSTVAGGVSGCNSMACVLSWVYVHVLCLLPLKQEQIEAACDSCAVLLHTGGGSGAGSPADATPVSLHHSSPSVLGDACTTTTPPLQVAEGAAVHGVHTLGYGGGRVGCFGRSALGFSGCGDQGFSLRCRFACAVLAHSAQSGSSSGGGGNYRKLVLRGSLW